MHELYLKPAQRISDPEYKLVYDTNKASGLTLIELIVVIALIAIMSAMAIPRLGLVQTGKLDGAARTAWSDMHHAKMTAIKENRNIEVIFNGNGYHFQRKDDPDNKPFFTRTLAGEYNGVSISKKSGDQSFTLVFTSKGTMNPPSQTINISLADQSKEFKVHWTGRIGQIEVNTSD